MLDNNENTLKLVILYQLRIFLVRKITQLNEEPY